MVIFKSADIPKGVSSELYLTTIIIEFIFFLILLFIVLISVKKYIERRTKLNAQMVCILVGFSASLFFTALGKVTVLFYGWSFENGMKLDIVAVLLIIFTNCVFMYFSLELFTDMSSKKKKGFGLIYIAFYIPVIILLILSFFGPLNPISLICHLLLSFVLSVFIMKFAMNSAKNANIRIHKIGMRLIFFTGLFLGIFYVITTLSWILITIGVLAPFNLLYFISLVLMIIAIIFVYIGFFQPKWFKKLVKSENSNN